MSARRALVCGGVSLVLLAPTASAYGSTVTIGQTSAAHVLCQTNFDVVQLRTGPGVASYVVPLGGGRIVSWSTQGGPDKGLMAVEIWRRTASPDRFILVGISPEEQIAPNVLNTFSLASPIVVQAGDLLGDHFEFADCLAIGGTQADDVGQSPLGGGPLPTPGQTETLRSIGGGVELNIAAQVAPPAPTSKDQCKQGGWQTLTDRQGRAFVNQGQCIAFVEHQQHTTTA